MKYGIVDLNDEETSLVILDQSKLPNKIEYISLKDKEDIWKSIYTLQVRGSTVIGVAAAIGVYVIVNNVDTKGYDEFFSEFKTVKEYLASSRPTAINLFCALDRMENVVVRNSEKPIEQIKLLLRDEALSIKAESFKLRELIGKNGAELIKNGDGILTCCYSGMALSIIHEANNSGRISKVFVCETRPLFQGMRLTASDLAVNGIETTVICDNMVSQVMRNKWVQAVFVGCDQLAQNGDACNKIGSSGIAILAKHYGIPFYVCTSIADVNIKAETGSKIFIEERDSSEITDKWFKNRMAPEGIKVYNPSFDYIDNELITAIITECGVFRKPYNDSLKDFIKETA